MDRLEFDDVEVSFEVHGQGERVVLVHASPFVSWYAPLVERLDGYSTLTYRRHLRRPAGGELPSAHASPRTPPPAHG